MADIKWIKITTDIFDDEKIKIIDTMPARDEIIVIWFKLLSLAGKVNQSGLLFMNSKIAYTPEMLAAIFNREVNTVRLALSTFEQFEMISIEDNEIISICNWEKHQNVDGMDKINEQNRLRQQKYRNKQKALTNSNVTDNVTVTDSNAIEEEEDKDKEKEILCALFFEEAWKKYPNKKGKGKVSDTQKKRLYKLGEELDKCIERYVGYVKTEEWLKFQNGSTFFNSGYVDYLDDNYTEAPKPKTIKEIKIPETVWEEEEDYGCSIYD